MRCKCTDPYRNTLRIKQRSIFPLSERRRDTHPLKDKKAARGIEVKKTIPPSCSPVPSTRFSTLTTMKRARPTFTSDDATYLLIYRARNGGGSHPRPRTKRREAKKRIGNRLTAPWRVTFAIPVTKKTGVGARRSTGAAEGMERRAKSAVRMMAERSLYYLR